MDQDTTEEFNDEDADAPIAGDADETLIDTDGSASVGPEGTQKLPPSHPLRQGTDLSGSQLGEYRLVRKIAKGGMGEVYEGVQLALDRRVAVKIIAEELVSDPSFVQRFEREAKSSAALNHPNVAQVYDFGKDGNRLFLVMEYVEGLDLSRHVRRHGPLSITDGLSVARQVASALNFALGQSIIHRDIKPANILWTPEKVAKITDLGLAKKLTEESDVTMTGTGIGSPHYLAPEQADDARAVDHRADIYALGITLLFLLTGKRPFDGESAFAVVLAHANKPLPSSADLGTALPADLETLIRRMAAKEANDRHPDYDSLLEDIARVELGLPASPASDRQAGSAENPKSTPNGALIMFGSVVVFATALFFAIKKVEPPTPGLNASNSPPTPTTISATPGSQPPPEPASTSTVSAAPPRPQRGGPPGPDGWPIDERYRPGIEKILPIVERVSETPLPDSDIDSMLKLADDYAKENPDQYPQILARYHQVVIKAKGGPRFAEVTAKHDAWFQTYWAAEQKAVQEYQQRMLEFNQDRTPHLGLDIWKDFPKNLRSKGLNDYLADYLLKFTPPSFLWDLTFAPTPKDDTAHPAGRPGGPGGQRPDQRGPKGGKGFRGPKGPPIQ